MPEPAVATAYRSALKVIADTEPEVADAIVGELESQRRQLKLIASENYASPAVLLAMGNWFSDKYAEGTPGHRLYAGCEMVDRIETLAADHAKALFSADHAYVQPHWGSTPTWSPTGPSWLTGSTTRLRPGRRATRQRPRFRGLELATRRVSLPAHDGDGTRRRWTSHPRVSAKYLREAL